MSRASASALSLDRALLRLARTRGHSPAMERAVARFSRLGEHGAVWLLLGALGARFGGAPSAWRHARRRVALAYVANTALKLAIRRRRPAGGLTGTPTGLAFPSAHAATSFAAARGYGRAGAPRAPLYALAGALAYSRLYLGVHHPSDVLAGALLGTVVGG